MVTSHPKGDRSHLKVTSNPTSIVESDVKGPRHALVRLPAREIQVANSMALPKIRGPGLAETIYISRAKKQGEGGDDASRRVRVSAEILSKLFHLPTREAALKLGICPTTFKKACRRLGIPHWPYHKGVLGHYSCWRSDARPLAWGVCEVGLCPGAHYSRWTRSPSSSCAVAEMSASAKQPTPLPDCIKEILDYLDTAPSIDLVSIKHITGSSADEDEDHRCVSEPVTLAAPVLLRAE